MIKKLAVLAGTLLISSLSVYTQTHVYVEGLIDFSKNEFCQTGEGF
jgi:hypothetical protein